MKHRRSLKATLSLALATMLLVPVLLASGGTVHGQGGLSSPAGGVSSALVPGGWVSSYQLSKPTAYPLGITTDEGGNVWFAEDNFDALVEFNPSNSTFRTFNIPTDTHLAWIWFLAFDQSGYLWFSDESQSLIWRFSPSTGTFVNFTAGGASPFAIAYDSARSRIWFTSLRTDQVGYFTLSDEKAQPGRILNLSGSSVGAGPSGIVVGQDGNVYLAETFEAKIVELNGSDLSVLRTWELPADSEPVGLALDAAHGRLWFTNHASSFFGYVPLGSSGFREFPTSLFYAEGSYVVSLPYWIEVSSDGRVWFDEHSANRIGRFDPSTMQLTEFQIPSNGSSPLRLTVDDRRGVVWLTEFVGNALGRVDESSASSQAVSTSTAAATLSPSTRFSVTSESASSSPPYVSVTSSMTGVPGPAFSVSVTQRNQTSSDVAVTALEATTGNYTAGVCFDYNASDQCGFVVLIVPPVQSHDLLFDAVYAGIGIVVVALLVLLRREAAAKRGSGSSGVGQNSSVASRRRTQPGQ
jgi:hypothetical protein